MLLRLLEKPWKISSKGVSDLGQKIYEEEKRIYIYIYIYISCAIFILRFAYLPARRAMKPGGLPRGAARKVYEL